MSATPSLPCPHCGAATHPDETICGSCGSMLAPFEKRNAHRRGEPPAKTGRIGLVLLALSALIGLVMCASYAPLIEGLLYLVTHGAG